MPAGFWISFGSIWAIGIIGGVTAILLKRSIRKDYEREGKPWTGILPRDS
jgi:hypothetical protein